MFRYLGNLEGMMRINSVWAGMFGTAMLVGTASGQAPLPQCRVGLHLERAGVMNYPAVIDGYDPKKGAYHVKYDNGNLPEWLTPDRMTRSCVAAPAPAVSDATFIGDWEMFVGPAPQHQIIGGDTYIVVGPGAVAPPLSIKPDGTYSWAISRGQVISGKWRRMTPAEMKYGYKDKPGIMLMNGYDGRDWQVTFSGVRSSDKRDQLNVQRMDLGVSFLATRMRSGSKR